MHLDSNKLLLYFYTLRYLTFSQISYRILYLLKRNFFCFKISSTKKNHSITVYPIKLKNSDIRFYNSDLSLILNNEFTFLNQTISFGKNVNWHYSLLNQGTRLWKLNLNYHEYLIDIANLFYSDFDKKYIQYIEKHINEWWNQNPLETPESYKDNWNSYAISLRIISWIKIYSIIEKELTPEFKNKFINSLKDQLNFLKENLEYDIKGNHLIENFFALLYGSYAFNDKKLFKKTKTLLSNELNEQILSDGAHFELSPMYHQTILNRLLDCINLLQNNQRFDDQDQLLDLMQEKAEKMLAWLNTVTFTNGQIPFLNDAAPNMAPSTLQINKYATALNLKHASCSLQLTSSGYRKFTSPNYECIIDIGQIGPAYQPGHAHADTFNFVLNVNDEPIIVDTGISTYNSGETRLNERGTAAHNTVTIQNKNSSEVWSSFRVARRAKVDILRDEKKRVIARHNGYKRKGTIHQREWNFSDDKIEITDTLSGKIQDGKAHFWLSSSVNPQKNGQTLVINNIRITFENPELIDLISTQIPAGYNKFIETHKIEVTFKHRLKTIIAHK